MVAMPFINDQISNAKRIVELGIGRKVRSFPSRGVELYRAVAEVLRDKEMRRRCRMLQKRLIEEQSFAVIVTKIEQLMERE